jgi:hypothetical protein
MANYLQLSISFDLKRLQQDTAITLTDRMGISLQYKQL